MEESQNIKIEINGGLHEDSLNIINSSGNIKGLSIKNSFRANKLLPLEKQVKLYKCFFICEFFNVR